MLVAVRVSGGRGWVLAGGLISALAALVGCDPCASIGGRRNLTIFETPDNTTEFQACARTGECLALCRLELNPTGGSSFVVDECRRVDGDAGTGTANDALTVAIRYHAGSCG
jgi:hypothetical protein